MFRVDDHVLAQWEDGYWYPARVNSVGGAFYEVVFDDGDVGSYDSSKVRRLDWGSGTRVQCLWKQSAYYGATILERRHLLVWVRYDDDVEERTTISRCRLAGELN